MNTIRSRSIAARAGLVLGIAALVVAGGLLAGLRGGEGSPATQAAPSAVRATLDPVTSLTGDAAQVSELQSRLQLHPANARARRALLGIAYLQRARETKRPVRTTRRPKTLFGQAPCSSTPRSSTPSSDRARWPSRATTSPAPSPLGRARPRPLAGRLAELPSPSSATRRSSSAATRRRSRTFDRPSRVQRPNLVAYARQSSTPSSCQGDGEPGVAAMRHAVRPARAPRAHAVDARAARPRCCSIGPRRRG